MQLPNPNEIRDIQNALWCEHQVQRIITEQEQNGTDFDKNKASFYVHTLRERRLALYRRIRPLLSLEVSRPYPAPVSKPFLKTGGYSNSVCRWYTERDIHRVGGPFSRVVFLEPDLGSRKKLAAQLTRLGWVPRHRTEKGFPQITVGGEPCSSLESIGSEIGGWISEWFILGHRESQIEGWLKLVREDGRISAEAITIGTPTFRMRHRGVVNVPRSGALFGKRMRSLFCVKDRQYRMVGYDASGLEFRMLADVINDTKFTKEVTDGDIHTKNQRDAGLPDRDTAKTFIYAFIYGAGDGKIGEITRGSGLSGGNIRRRFLRANPALAEAIETTQRAASRGFLIGLDGRKLSLRRDKFTGEVQTHKALNTRLQGAGATVMKWTMVILDEWLRQSDIQFKKVIDMHDESQLEVKKEQAELVGTLAVEAIKYAGVLLELNVPLDGEYKIGLNWSDTH